MNRIALARPSTFEQAAALAGGGDYSLPVVKAGGMDVIDHMKEGLQEPDLLIDVKRIGQRRDAEGITRMTTGGIRIEATTTLAEIAGSPLVTEMSPAVAQAVASAATPQVRNVATAAGNLLQRPRCWYYRQQQFDCLKKGGHTCYAVEGENRYHAVFGGGPCHIVHPSNLAVALFVCDGAVHVVGGEGRSIPITGLYHLPDRGLTDEHNLQAEEVVTHLTLKPAPRSAFYAIREKQSFDWPLVMAAAALELEGRTIASARICVGAVAPVPWPLPTVGEALRGVRLDDEQALGRACGHAADGARPMTDNAYKLKLLPVVVRRVVLRAAGEPVEALT
jgi:xanthine dehydrogenase YagS FAD-binding subunit